MCFCSTCKGPNPLPSIYFPSSYDSEPVIIWIPIWASETVNFASLHKMTILILLWSFLSQPETPPSHSALKRHSIICCLCTNMKRFFSLSRPTEKLIFSAALIHFWSKFILGATHSASLFQYLCASLCNWSQPLVSSMKGRK